MELFKPKKVSELLSRVAQDKYLIGNTKRTFAYDMGKYNKAYDGYVLHMHFDKSPNGSQAWTVKNLQAIKSSSALTPVEFNAPKELLAGGNIGQPLMLLKAKAKDGPDVTVSIQLKQEGETVAQRLAGPWNGKRARSEAILKEIVDHAEQNHINPLLAPVRQLRGLLERRYVPDVAKGNIVVDHGEVRLLDQTTNADFGLPIVGIPLVSLQLDGHVGNLVKALTEGADPKSPNAKRVKDLVNDAKRTVYKERGGLVNLLIGSTTRPEFVMAKPTDAKAIALDAPPSDLLSQLNALKAETLR